MKALLPLLLALLTPVMPVKPVADGSKHAQPTLAQIADEVDEGNGDNVEPLLLQLHAANPNDAEVLTQLARIEYIRATEGRAQPADGFPMSWDSAHMNAAERWAERAVAANPRHANAWIAYGQIKNARMDSEESLKMLERAESLDPTSVKLRLRKGDTLRALMGYRGDPSLLTAAAHEYEQVIKGEIDDGNEQLAAQRLAQIRSRLGQFEAAQELLTKALHYAKGNGRAFLLNERANVYLEAGQVDLALVDSRAALEIINFGVGRNVLAEGLLIKAGLAMRDGDEKQAVDWLRKAFETGASLREQLSIITSSPGKFPGFYALFVPEFRSKASDEMAADVIGASAWFIKPEDLRKLHALGVSFDRADEYFGTTLHRAIQQENVAAVRTLLELGVDTSVLLPNGSTLLESTLVGTSPKRREIRQLVVAKVGAPKGWKDPEVDLPVKGHWYRAERSIGVAGEPVNQVIQPSMTLLAGGGCQSTKTPTICLTFDYKPGAYFGTVTVPFSRVEDLKALHEVPEPPTTESAQPPKTDIPVAAVSHVAGMPIPGRWYHVDRSIGVADDPAHKILPRGTTLLAGQECTSTLPATLCLTFLVSPGKYFGIVVLPLSKAEDLKALREVPAPRGSEAK